MKRLLVVVVAFLAVPLPARAATSRSAPYALYRARTCYMHQHGVCSAGARALSSGALDGYVRLAAPEGEPGRGDGEALSMAFTTFSFARRLHAIRFTAVAAVEYAEVGRSAPTAAAEDLAKLATSPAPDAAWLVTNTHASVNATLSVRRTSCWDCLDDYDGCYSAMASRRILSTWDSSERSIAGAILRLPVSLTCDMPPDAITISFAVSLAASLMPSGITCYAAWSAGDAANACADVGSVRGSYRVRLLRVVIEPS